MAERYIANLARIARAAEQSGPLLYTVREHRLDRVRLECD